MPIPAARSAAAARHGAHSRHSTYTRTPRHPPGRRRRYILLQAFRRLRFTARGLQYAYLSLTVAVALPLTLGVDGTAWGPQFAGWTGGDWALLVTGATVVYVGQNMLIQVGLVCAVEWGGAAWRGCEHTLHG